MNTMNNFTERTLDFIIMHPTDANWRRNRDKIPPNEMRKIAVEHNLGDFTKRLVAQKSLHLIVYSEALKVATIEDLAKNVATKLQFTPYMTENIARKWVRRKGFETNAEIATFQEGAKKKIHNPKSGTAWAVDLFCMYTLLVTKTPYDREDFVEFVTAELERLLDKQNLKEDIEANCSLLRWDKPEVRRVIATRCEQYQPIIESTFIAWFGEQIVQKQEVVSGEEFSFIDSLVDTICNIDETTANEEQTKVEEVVKKEPIEVAANDVPTQQEEHDKTLIGEVQESVENVTQNVVEQVQETVLSVSETVMSANNNKQVAEHLRNLCSALGFNAHTDAQVANIETKVLARLLEPSVGAPLSQLYNIYKTLDQHSIANIEAVLCTFFGALELAGLEFKENGQAVGETMTINGNEVGKEYKVTKPINTDGEIEVSVEYLETTYKGKRLTPIAVKPIN